MAGDQLDLYFGRAALIEWALPETAPLARAWLEERIPHAGGWRDDEAVYAGVTTDDRILAVIAFHDWQPTAKTLQLTMAADSPRWASKAVLAALFNYAFRHARANKLWTATPHDNERAIRFNRGIGMKQEAVLRHHFGPGRHATICSMLAAEYRQSRWSDA